MSIYFKKLYGSKKKLELKSGVKSQIKDPRIEKIEHKNMFIRELKNKIFIYICSLFAMLSLFILIFIICFLFFKGLAALNLDLLFKDTGSPFASGGNSGGGLRNAIIGQFILCFSAFLISAPIGILSATYLNEYARSRKIIEMMNNICDMLLSMPSIVVATFVYSVVVINFGGFSGYAGVLSLCIIMLPFITKLAYDALRLVPLELKEASAALGSPKHLTILKVIYPAAKGTLITSLLLSFSRIMGESAPLLFTSLNNIFLKLDMKEAFPSLTITIYEYSTSPHQSWQDLAYAGAFLLCIFIFILNLVARFLNK